MKKILITLTIAALAVVLNGCTMVTYTRSVSVRTDASGKVIERVDFESITEPHQETPRITSPENVNLQLLK
jgi:PBP1b-binding outer membrane lipoprotein LpoB